MRHFICLLALGLAQFALSENAPAAAASPDAQNSQKDGEQTGQERRRQRGDRADSDGRQRGPNAQRGQQGNGQQRQRPQMDPAKMVERIMGQFDKDGDSKLDANELTAMLTAMRERGMGRAFGAGQGRPGQKPGDDRGQQGKRKRGGKDGDQTDASEAGGDRPVRPPRKDNS